MWFKNLIRCAERSPKWKTVRKNHLKTHNKCESCEVKKNLEVHHVVPVHVDPTRELDPSNFMTLCESCHLLFGHLMNWKSYNENVREDCAKITAKIKNRP